MFYFYFYFYSLFGLSVGGIDDLGFRLCIVLSLIIVVNLGPLGFCLGVVLFLIFCSKLRYFVNAAILVGI